MCADNFAAVKPLLYSLAAKLPQSDVDVLRSSLAEDGRNIGELARRLCPSQKACSAATLLACYAAPVDCPRRMREPTTK